MAPKVGLAHGGGRMPAVRNIPHNFVPSRSKVMRSLQSLLMPISKFVSDHGASGVSVPLAERPQGKRLFDMLRAGDVLVVRWLDRLVRNYGDVTQSVQKFMQRGVIIKTARRDACIYGGKRRLPQRCHL
jgi:hypothetical protein